jgi:F0F1-type ATP synthase membrane subunit b/b'
MDEKQPTQTPRGVSTPKSIQSQPPRADAGGALSKVSSAVDSSSTEKSGEVHSPAAPALRTETARQSRALAAVLDASRAELDQLLGETQKIHERSWRVIHTLLEDSQLRASQAMDACLVRFEKEIQDRISNEIATMLQNFDVEAGARLTARLDQALATAKQRQRSIEQDLAVAVAENRKQLDQISTGAVDALRQSEQSLLGDLKKEAERQLGEFAKNASQISDNIQQLSDGLSAQLKQRTEEAVGVFQSRMEQVWQQAVERAEERITETAQTCTTELAKQARQVVDREMSEFLSQALRRFDRSSNERTSNQNS